MLISRCACEQNLNSTFVDRDENLGLSQEKIHRASRQQTNHVRSYPRNCLASLLPGKTSFLYFDFTPSFLSFSYCPVKSGIHRKEEQENYAWLKIHVCSEWGWRKEFVLLIFSLAPANGYFVHLCPLLCIYVNVYVHVRTYHVQVFFLYRSRDLRQGKERSLRSMTF